MDLTVLLLRDTYCNSRPRTCSNCSVIFFAFFFAEKFRQPNELLKSFPCCFPPPTAITTLVWKTLAKKRLSLPSFGRDRRKDGVLSVGLISR